MGAQQDLGQRRSQVLARLFTSAGKPRADLHLAPPLGSADVAALFRMSERGIRMWVSKHGFPHTRTLGGGKLQYPADKIADLYVERQTTAFAQRASSHDAEQGRRA